MRGSTALLSVLPTGEFDRLVLMPDSVEWMQLRKWSDATLTGEYDFTPDFRRLKIEHWVWSKVVGLPPTGRVLEIGTYFKRNYLPCEYVTLGLGNDAVKCDIVGDVVKLPPEADGPWDVIICTEVLEHCADPFAGVREMHRVLKPNGVLLASTPFLWPDHGHDGTVIADFNYPDYWRFTRQGWQRMASMFSKVIITDTPFTATGAALYEVMRQVEAFGPKWMTKACTGFMVEAIK